MEYDPSEVIAHAHKLTLLPGACTACVLQLDGSNSTLYGANVGDSGFLVIRDGELVFESPSMQHYFDCPFQVLLTVSSRPSWLRRHAGDASAMLLRPGFMQRL